MKIGKKNLEELIKELAEILKKLRIECNDYDTNIFAVCDENGNFDYFDVIPEYGDNHWEDGSHTFLCVSEQINEKMIDWYQSIEEIADILEIEESELVKKIAVKNGCDEEDIDYYGVCDYVSDDEEYMKILQDEYIRNVIDPLDDEFWSKAEEVLNNLFEN